MTPEIGPGDARLERPGIARSSAARPPSLRACLLAGAAALGLASAPAFANPTGGVVAAGAATIGGAGNRVTIQQSSNRAIINWNGFSIGANEITRFVQPSADAAILNRVTGGAISSLQGQLQSNGKVYLLNPNGIVVGPGGRIDTGTFIASTLNVSDSSFMGQGTVTFDGDSSASIVNLGIIRSISGDVVLIASKISNAGTISAPNGTAALAAGKEVLYAPDGGNLTA